MIFTSYCNLGYDTHVFPHRCFLYFNLHSGNQDKNKTEEINVVTSTQAHIELAILFALLHMIPDVIHENLPRGTLLVLFYYFIPPWI